MRKFITVFALTVCSVWPSTLSADGPHRSASLDNLRIKGVMMYDNDRSTENTGLYSYTVKAPVSRRQLTSMPRLYANGGSVAVDNRLYTYSYEIAYGYVSSARYYVYDLVTGAQISSTSMGYDLTVAYSHAAVSSAVDPVSGDVYSSGYEYNATDKTLSVKLKIWNLAENTKTTVGDMTAPLIAMAFDNEGQLWGITASSSTTSTDGGYLVKVDKTTGTQTLVGDTGVRPYYDQSAVIDPARGTFYWLANTQTEEANLYEVDLATGKATLIGAFPNGDEVVATTIDAEEYDDAAPSPAANLTATARPDHLLDVQFDMPATSYDGSALTGSLTWSIEVKGTETIVRSGTATAGAHVAETLDAGASGAAQLSVSISKGELTGPAEIKDVYAGYDKMLPAANVTLKYENGVNALTWEAPAAGHFNGLISADGLRYRIIRMPEDVVVAEAHPSTTYTETVTDDNLRSTYYKVSAINGDVIGDEASSNSVVTGSAVTPPYSQDFNEADALDLYTIVDANKDNNTWYYSVKSAKYRQSTSTGADDYLFMPAFNLKGGNSYELSFDGYNTSSSYTNLIEVVIASSPEAEAATAVTESPISFANDSRTVTNEKVIVKPEADGKYYIGFHIVSAQRQGTFTIDNVVLSAGKSTAVPAAADMFDVTPGASGALNARIKVTAPSQTAAGEQLGQEELSFTVLRGETEIHSGTIAPGANTAIDDENIAGSGIYTYAVWFANSEGSGETAETTVFVGTDTPSAPSDVILTDCNDGRGLVSWTASGEGINGGYVDEANVIYTVISATGNEIIKTGIKGTSAEIPVTQEGTQTIYSVKVAAAYTDNATATAAASNEILAGKPYAMPYAESFAGAAASTSPWIKETVSGKSYDTSWAARADYTYDNDGGAADMTAYSAASSRWAGPKIDISNTVKPQASAYVYLPGGNTRLTLQLQKDNGEWIDLGSVDDAADEWVLLTAPLADYKSRNVRLGLLGECFGGMRFIYVDNITVNDLSSGIDNLTDSNMEADIRTTDGKIIITAATEIPLAVYTADGRCVVSITSRHAEIPACAGVYIVRAGTRTVKIIL